MQIHIYSTDIPIVDGLALKYPQVQWITLQHSSEIKHWPSNEQQIIILRSPVQVGAWLLSPEQLWKNYLAEQFPSCKFIVTGFAEAQHSNYLDLLNPPADLIEFMQQARPADEDWLPINTGAINMTEKLKNFFSGHGKESIMDILAKILRPLKMTLEAVKVQNRSFQEAAEFMLADFPSNWQLLESRWQRYFYLFNCLPFFELFEKSNTLIENLSANLKNNDLIQKDITKIEQVFESVIFVKELMSKAYNYV